MKINLGMMTKVIVIAAGSGHESLLEIKLGHSSWYTYRLVRWSMINSINNLTEKERERALMNISWTKAFKRLIIKWTTGMQIASVQVVNVREVSIWLEGDTDQIRSQGCAFGARHTAQDAKSVLSLSYQGVSVASIYTPCSLTAHYSKFFHGVTCHKL